MGWGLLKERAIGSVLDLGCGLGAWGYLMRTYIAPNAQIVGLDISKEKIDTLSKLRIYDSLVVGDAMTVQVNGCFDAILAGELILAVSDPDAFLRRFEQKLAKGGVLVIMGPSDKKLRQLLRKRGYLVYDYLLRGFFLVDENSGKAKLMHETKAFSIIGAFLRVSHRLIRRRDKMHVIAFKEMS
jgi:ubiquinone/menaquinone biosynthesis C-methylase UbiE